MKKLALAVAVLFTMSTAFVSCRDKKTTTDDVEDVMDDVADDVEDAVDDDASDPVENTIQEGVNEVQENTGMGGEDDA